MGTRAAKRIRLVLPVRVWGMDMNGKPFIQMAHTLDVNRTGARLGGVKVKLASEEVVGVQYRAKKARFKVMWIGEHGTRRQDQIGIRSLPEEKDIWPAELPDDRGSDEYEQPVERGRQSYLTPGLFQTASEAVRSALASVTGGEAKSPVRNAPAAPNRLGVLQQESQPQHDKRIHTRYSCRGGVEVRKPGTASGHWAALSDVSMGGCYIETAAPLAKDAKVRLFIKTDEFDIEAESIVRTVHPGVGMGAEFRIMDDDDRESLAKLIAYLASGEHASAVVPASANEEITERLSKTTEELRSIEDLMTSGSVDALVLREFRAALGHVRHTAWALQEALVLESKRDDLNPVVSFLNTERIRMATRLCKNIAADIQLKQFKIERKEFNELLASVEDLFMRLAGLNFCMDDAVAGVEGHEAPSVDSAEEQPTAATRSNGSADPEAPDLLPMTEAQHFAAAAELEIAVQDIPIFEEARKQARRADDRGEQNGPLAVAAGAEGLEMPMETSTGNGPDPSSAESERRRKRERRRQNRRR